MSIAKKFVKELSLISRDEKGFYNVRLSGGWIARVRHASYEFADGSMIVIGNPDQITYSLNVYED